MSVLIPAQWIHAQITNTVVVPPPSTFTLDSVTVTTASGPGIQANGNGTIDASNVIITTTGVDGFGAFATTGGANTGGTISITGSTVTTSGSGAAGLALSSGQKVILIRARVGSTMIVSNSTVTTSGANGYGISTFGSAGLNFTDSITLDNTTVTTSQADGIHLDDNANVTILLKDETIVNPGNGVLMRTTAHGQRVANLTADGNVTLSGDILVESTTAVVNVALLNNSVLTGAMEDVTNVSIGSGSL